MQLGNRNPSVREVRKFGLVMLCGFVVLAGLFWWSGKAEEGGWGWSGSGLHWASAVLAVLGLIILLTTLTSHAAGRVVYVVWMTAATYLGTVMTLVLLSALFVVLLPIFSLIRFKDPLRMKLKAGGSYWEDHTHHESTLERTIHPF
jgi:hypothetical protein